MMLPITVATATILSLSLLLVFLLRRLGSDRHILPVTTDWLRDLSVERYRPMQRLLDDSDFQFLRTQKGYTPNMASHLRTQRAQAFRGYLGMLQSDFDRVAITLQLILTQSAQDRPELAYALFQRRLTFALKLLLVECRLGLFRLGLSGADVSGLISLLDGLRLELRTLVPVSSAVAA